MSARRGAQAGRSRALALVVGALLLAVAVGIFLLNGSGGSSGGSASPTSDLPTVTVADLPPEARETLELIEAGGPFPYRQDGATFGNRERLLPQQERGYYREYTVETPGSRDRGARRIVTGEGGDRYWTQDHYRSFAEIAQTEETR